MSSRILYRVSGLTALVAGILLASLDVSAFVLIGQETPGITREVGVWVLLLALRLVVLVSTLLGLVGLYTYRTNETEPLGLVVFLLTFASMLVLSGYSWARAIIVPVIAEALPFMTDVGPSAALTVPPGITLTWPGIGLFLFGVMSLLANILPRWTGVLLVAAAVAAIASALLVIPLGPKIMLGALLVWLGYVLWMERQPA
jgi:hypothetical protein